MASGLGSEELQREGCTALHNLAMARQPPSTSVPQGAAGGASMLELAGPVCVARLPERQGGSNSYYIEPNKTRHNHG